MAAETSKDSSPIEQIVQPFVDLFNAPRALQGVNWPFFIEGLAYFGILGYLTFYFHDYVALGDVWSGRMVGLLTMGITIAMFVLGGVADRWGIRRAIKS